MTTSPAPPRVVDDLMTVDLIAVRPSDRIGRARDLMLTVKVHALPVMEGNDVVGIVTSSDLVENWPDNDLVSTAMTSSPTVIDAEATLEEGASLMLERRIHHLLVEADGEVIGILTSLDLLRAFLPTQSFSS
jgi:signal-transduction protein with cAMP-binding, CBS, and nucleotidyltransferase domain